MHVLAVAGFCFWMAALHWLRLPHWATSFGWVALSFYFAFYLPVFVGLSRVAVHRLRVPVILAAPVVWTGLELARAHLLTGMSMASLGHTQYRWIELIQMSDLAGAYGVSFVVMFVAAALARMFPAMLERMCRGQPRLARRRCSAKSVHRIPSGRCCRPRPAGRRACFTDTCESRELVEGRAANRVDARLDRHRNAYDPDMKQRIFREYYDLSQAGRREEPEPRSGGLAGDDVSRSAGDI